MLYVINKHYFSSTPFYYYYYSILQKKIFTHKREDKFKLFNMI